MKSKMIPVVVCEEALDALLVRVRWYYTRGYEHSIPEGLVSAFNFMCDVLAKPDERPYHRIRGRR